MLVLIVGRVIYTLTFVLKFVFYEMVLKSCLLRAIPEGAPAKSLA